MSLLDVVEYTPLISTYAIRIISPFYKRELWDEPLVDSPNYIYVSKYYFDDVEPFFVGTKDVMIDEEIARRVILDFKEHSKNVESLLVHCSQGKNRSPAVAIALNEIFDLGHNTENLMEKYSELNRYVYNMLRETAKKIL